MFEFWDSVPYKGELASLVSTLAFSMTPYFFMNASKQASSQSLNFWQITISTLLTALVLLISQESFFPQDHMRTYILLLISGVSGIGIANFLYFKALETTGPRLVILLETVAPAFTGLISYAYFGTTISLLKWLGILVTGVGVFIVVYQKEEKEKQELQEVDDEEQKISQKEINEKLIQSICEDQENQRTQIEKQQQEQEKIEEKEEKEEEENEKEKEEVEVIVESKKSVVIEEQQTVKSKSKLKILGILMGIGYAFFQSLGMVLAHDAAQSGKFSPQQTSFIRILVGLGCTILTILVKCERIQWPSKTIGSSCCFVCGVTFGPFLMIWSQQISLKYTLPEITQTIIALAPFFGLIIGFIRGDKIKLKEVIGSIISIAGVGMVVWL